MEDTSQVFSEKHMFTRLNALADALELTQFKKALYYAREKHAGQYRKAPVSFPGGERAPYIIHPLTMACHAVAMGIRDDDVLAVCMLHDVCEDCGVPASELPFDPPIVRSVDLLTRTYLDGESRESAYGRYYSRIRTDDIACLVKVLDRCNNISMMALAFSREKMKDYTLETEEYVLPLLDYIKRVDPTWSNAAFLLKYQMVTTLETVEELLRQQ